MSVRKSIKGWLWFAILIAAGGAFAWWRVRQPSSTSIEYRTATVGRGDIIQLVTANGQLSPLISVDVGSQVSGNITNLCVDFNSRGTSGQLVAELDAATYAAQVIRAETGVP